MIRVHNHPHVNELLRSINLIFNKKKKDNFYIYICVVKNIIQLQNVKKFKTKDQ